MAKRKSQSPENATASELSETTKPSRSSIRSKRVAPSGSESVGTPAEPERVVTRTEPGTPAAPEVITTYAGQAVDQEADVDPTEDDIRRRAYQRYLERGSRHGADFDDWLHAEQELKKRR